MFGWLVSVKRSRSDLGARWPAPARVAPSRRPDIVPLSPDPPQASSRAFLFSLHFSFANCFRRWYFGTPRQRGNTHRTSAKNAPSRRPRVVTNSYRGDLHLVDQKK
jgi:hypothetical protein